MFSGASNFTVNAGTFNDVSGNMYQIGTHRYLAVGISNGRIIRHDYGVGPPPGHAMRSGRFATPTFGRACNSTAPNNPRGTQHFAGRGPQFTPRQNCDRTLPPPYSPRAPAHPRDVCVYQQSAYKPASTTYPSMWNNTSNITVVATQINNAGGSIRNIDCTTEIHYRPPPHHGPDAGDEIQPPPHMLLEYINYSAQDLSTNPDLSDVETLSDGCSISSEFDEDEEDEWSSEIESDAEDVLAPQLNAFPGRKASGVQQRRNSV